MSLMKGKTERTVRSSELNRRYLCPGSMEAEAGMEEPEGRDLSDADRGTRLHKYLEQWLGGIMKGLDLEEGDEPAVIGNDDDMTIEILVSRIRRILSEFGRPDKVLLEQPLLIRGEYMISGHADVILIYPDSVVVID